MPKPISKSQFTLAQQCGKAFYLYRHRKELMEYTVTQEQLMQAGTSFGQLMQQRYQGGVDVSQEEDFNHRIALTNRLLEQADRPIYEATLTAEVAGVPLLCMVDIMVPTDQGWHLIEVKSGSRLKNQYVADAQFQCFVAQKKGVKVSRLSVLHVNTSYVRQGELDVHALGTLVDIAIAEVPDISKELAQLLVLDEGEEPQMAIGGHCYSPYICGFKAYCWSDFPKTDNVFKLLSGQKAMSQIEQGIYHLNDVDPSLFTAKASQRHQAWKNNAWIWNQEKVNAFLEQIKYPVYYLDFETVNPAIPPYDGLRPYQQICFQYSLHIQQEAGGEYEHREFLAHPDQGDPESTLVEQLVADIAEDDGSILVYNKSFESGQLKKLSERFPAFREPLNGFRSRMLDLLQPFRSLHIYHPNMGNSASLKVVLPQLVPELSYSDMEVGDGGMAMEAYKRLMHAALTEDERRSIREALLNYCKLDTWAMVKLVERMKEGPK